MILKTLTNVLTKITYKHVQHELTTLLPASLSGLAGLVEGSQKQHNAGDSSVPMGAGE